MDAQKVLEIQPDNVEGLLALSQVYMLKHDYQQADKILVQALHLAPGTINVRVRVRKSVYKVCKG